MALDIHDPETERLVRRLAERDGIPPVEAVKRAVSNELRRDEAAPSLWERTRSIREAIASSPPTGLEADKAFYDQLSGDA